MLSLALVALAAGSASLGPERSPQLDAYLQAWSAAEAKSLEEAKAHWSRRGGSGGLGLEEAAAPGSQLNRVLLPDEYGTSCLDGTNYA